MECHKGEFVHSCRGGQGNKVLFLCVVCVDTVYLLCFQGVLVPLFLVVISAVFHRVFISGCVQQMYVLFPRGFRLGLVARCSVASTPALSLPWSSSPWLFLLRGTCLEADSGEVVVDSTLSAGLSICRACFPRMRSTLVSAPKAGSRLPLLVSFVCGLSSLLVPQFL